jgi:perosamine synthetase
MLNPGYLTEYKKTEELEREIEKYLNVKHCIMVNNGTISLSLALLALDIKPGDKVIVPNITMIASINAIRFIGAIPILVDVDDRLLLDIDKAMSYIKKDSGIKAVMFVSLNGRWLAPTDEFFIEFCKERGIGIIDDAAQAFGSCDHNFVKIGNKCDIASFSFSMPKIITTGQGGCLTTNDDTLAQKLRRLKDFGRDSGGNDSHPEFGINSKFTEFQAVIGLTQLKTIDWRVQRKKEIYKKYYANLSFIDGIEFIATDLEYTTPWFIDVFVENRSRLIFDLKSVGVMTRPIYPALNTQKVNYGITDEVLPLSNKYALKGLWLPSSLTLKDEDIAFICKKVREFHGV